MQEKKIKNQTEFESLKKETPKRNNFKSSGSSEKSQTNGLSNKKRRSKINSLYVSAKNNIPLDMLLPAANFGSDQQMNDFYEPFNQ
jgi:hypothetical protein